VDGRLNAGHDGEVYVFADSLRVSRNTLSVSANDSAARRR
jgi:hypothetical protein